jgi:hypothetical protein
MVKAVNVLRECAERRSADRTDELASIILVASGVAVQRH